MGAKKAANLFRIYCFMCCCGAAGYSVFMLSVKPELEQAFNQLCSDVVLHIRIIIAVHFGEIADIPGISVKDSLYRYGVALMCFYYRVIGEKVGYSWDSTSISSFSRFKASWICRPIVLRVQPLCSPISFCFKCWK